MDVDDARMEKHETVADFHVAVHVYASQDLGEEIGAAVNLAQKPSQREPTR